MALPLHQDRLEAPLIHVAHRAMASVEGLGVDAVELPHPPRQISLRRLEEQVIVVLHEAVRMAQPLGPPDHRGQHVKQALPVSIIPEDPLTRIAPAGSVMHRPGVLDA